MAHVLITGTTDMLMHADNIEWADQMDAWKNNSKNKKHSKAGDDRTPPWRWIGCLNHDGQNVTIPTEYIMRCIMEGAAQVPTGKGQKTFKAQSQSGLLCRDFHWTLLAQGNPISMKEIEEVRKLETFKEQSDAVEALGFSLFTKRAKIGQSKHIRVRPRFEKWSISGDVDIIDKQITLAILQEILDICGTQKGLGDWRPGCKTPGPWGMFEAKVS